MTARPEGLVVVASHAQVCHPCGGPPHALFRVWEGSPRRVLSRFGSPTQAGGPADVRNANVPAYRPHSFCPRCLDSCPGSSPGQALRRNDRVESVVWFFSRGRTRTVARSFCLLEALLGKMSGVFRGADEERFSYTLQSPRFAGGCERHVATTRSHAVFRAAWPAMGA